MQSGKRLAVEVDSLPDDLIYKILSYVDTLYSVRLSVLSSRWRFIWISMPYLNFSSDEHISSSRYHEFVNNVLSVRCNNKIDVSSVSVMLGVNVTNRGLLLNSILDSILTMCKNLKNLTLERCRVFERDELSDAFTIINSRLLSLTLKKVVWHVDFVYVNTPQLKNLILVDTSPLEAKGYYGRSISALSGVTILTRDLTYLYIKGSYFPELCLDGFHSLEKVDLYISSPQKTNVHKIRYLLQRLHSVKSLALSLEIVELLSTSEEVISHQPSPFHSLKSLKIYPLQGLKPLELQCLRTYTLKSSLEMFPTQLDEEQEAMKKGLIH
ncbi:F-box domain, Leucine-rich repeat domain, L domain-like protein [Artemisia annua]|uniref:F-box domain, Leucine-rich repeat domain, L domain-like protein n=1 Tax=Artemisia annua TaxID=35608 RepID=A0A2U1M7E7_ARTAN|nr:F-box domain, Leucine-rich repeat domain, L domain-like protein [Artemisia annua]